MDVSELLSNVMQRPIPQLASSMTLAEIPGWNSVMTVRLMLTLEEAVGRELTESEIETVATIASVERLMNLG